MKLHILVYDEAGFGRVSAPAYCWVFGSERPTVPSVRVRQYVNCYGATEPATGAFYWEIYKNCNSENFSDYLHNLSEIDDDSFYVILTDRASWHTSTKLVIPENIRLVFIPPSTPEMNPQEQIWREIRTVGFKNIMLNSIDEVCKKIEHSINIIPPETFSSITSRAWLPAIC